MTLIDLHTAIQDTIKKLRDHGVFPKENNLYDYKLKLNYYGINDPVEIFMRNFAKDILSFSNGGGGIIIIGIKEDKATGSLEDIGLQETCIDILKKVDLNDIVQKFNKIAKIGINIDLQSFQTGTRKFYYLLIEKQSQVIIPMLDSVEYNIKKGEVIYRSSGKNETANFSTQEFNKFLQIKANEKNKEFMEIWSKLLPELFDINPREVLIINPISNRVYGFNGKNNVLSSTNIEIDKSEDGIFNVILNAISAGDIGKISDDEGKPLYKIIGEIRSSSMREHISLSTLLEEIRSKSKYKISFVQLKEVFKYLGWVTDSTFKVESPTDNPVNEGFEMYIWLEKFDSLKKLTKVVCSKEVIEIVLPIVNDSSLHAEIFNRSLSLINTNRNGKAIPPLQSYLN
ncbi:RNA-binding domain-containing protein [Fibrella sp. ES10-3-2-2]|nr:hypothetical protein A6C57_12515 [Fibrella sp. ES10-3-2-2]